MLFRSGGDGYKKWTGYSVGYHLVKQEHARHPNISWQEFIKFLQENRGKLQLEI